MRRGEYMRRGNETETVRCHPIDSFGGSRASTLMCMDPSAPFPVEMSMRPKSLCPGRGLAQGSPEHLGDRALAKPAVPRGHRCPLAKTLLRDWSRWR